MIEEGTRWDGGGKDVVQLCLYRENEENRNYDIVKIIFLT